jgi:hypothetical protein
MVAGCAIQYKCQLIIISLLHGHSCWLSDWLCVFNISLVERSVCCDYKSLVEWFVVYIHRWSSDGCVQCVLRS